MYDHTKKIVFKVSRTLTKLTINLNFTNQSQKDNKKSVSGREIFKIVIKCGRIRKSALYEHRGLFLVAVTSKNFLFYYKKKKKQLLLIKTIL